MNTHTTQRNNFRIAAILISATVCSLAMQNSAQAVITWDGGGGANMDIFLDTNWAGDPVVNSGVSLSDDVVIGPGFTAVVGHSQMFSVDSGRTITLNDATITSTSTNSQFQPDASLNPSGTEAIVLNGTSSVTIGWGWNNEWVLNDTSSVVTLNTNTNANGGAIGELSTVAFNGNGASFEFRGVNLATTTTNAWTNKMMVNGEAVVLGTNLIATATNNGNGSLFTAVIEQANGTPEPTSIVLAALGVVGLVSRRRRR